MSSASFLCQRPTGLTDSNAIPALGYPRRNHRTRTPCKHDGTAHPRSGVSSRDDGPPQSRTRPPEGNLSLRLPKVPQPLQGVVIRPGCELPTIQVWPEVVSSPD
ncbi:putative protein with NUDIX domain protein [Trichinella spiralis]|uniref:putative protein with NUDIX domain protein n=1 Tax=Trichinella spiralis TaxID=6334 RepID=UPI0001EFEEE9|nr:putative protein with NUDIX domain protein [Trichinella spiralis]